MIIATVAPTQTTAPAANEPVRTICPYGVMMVNGWIENDDGSVTGPTFGPRHPAPLMFRNWDDALCFLIQSAGNIVGKPINR